MSCLCYCWTWRHQVQGSGSHKICRRRRSSFDANNVERHEELLWLWLRSGGGLAVCIQVSCWMLLHGNSRRGWLWWSGETAWMSSSGTNGGVTFSSVDGAS